MAEQKPTPNKAEVTNKEPRKVESTTKPEQTQPQVEVTVKNAPAEPPTEKEGTPDVQAARRSKVSEAEVKGLRTDAGINGMAGHQANVKVWENSEQGKAFIAKAKHEAKKAEQHLKLAHEGLDSDDKSEPEKEYEETVEQ